MKHAGIHWPENAGGEYPNVETILGMPGIKNGCTLICSPSARYWYRQARGASPLVVWRAIPRQGKLPAQLNWIGKAIADECLNLWDEQPHGGIEHFTPLNELQFIRESGEEFRSYAETASKLSNVRIALRQRFQSLGQTVRLMFPAWVPTDDMDRLSKWEDEARQWDSIGLHCYGSAGLMYERYLSYRGAFPHHPIFVGEWNANHEDHDERAALQMWADIANSDPAFLGATYYIWETNNAGERDLSIYGNPDRLSLFMDPPAVKPAPEPQPEPEPIPPEPIMPAWEHWSAEEIARITECPLAAVNDSWPRLVEQLTHCSINDKDVQAAMIGTVAIESASTFYPVREAFYLGEPEPAEEYRKTLRYYPYYGRGYIQLTWQSNYAVYGPKIAELWGAGGQEPDFDLVGNPDNALNPDISAAVSALYFRDTATVQGYALPDAARAHDWEWVRRLVQGGTAGLDRLTAICSALLGQTPETLIYNPYQTPERQVQDWACSIRAATWALKSMGVAIDAGQMQDEMVPGAVTPAQGLLDARGYGLAAAIGRHVPQSTKVEVLERASWDDLLQRAGCGPLCVGSISLYHWLNVAYLDPAGYFVAPNPAPNWQGIGDDLTREEFARWAPWSAVFVEVTPAVVDTAPTYEQLATLEGVSYHEDGTVIPALLGAKASGDWSQVDAVVSFLRSNDPHRAA